MAWCGVRGEPSRVPQNHSMGSTDHGGDQPVTLADCLRIDKPQIPFAIVCSGGAQNAALFHVNHNGMDGALMAPWVHSHASDDLRAGLGTLLNQGRTDSGADQ